MSAMSKRLQESNYGEYACVATCARACLHREQRDSKHDQADVVKSYHWGMLQSHT